jgi:hypothetical protein
VGVLASSRISKRTSFLRHHCVWNSGSLVSVKKKGGGGGEGAPENARDGRRWQYVKGRVGCERVST